MEEELKDNLCEINFICFEGKYGNKCVHHKTKKQCKFFNENHYTCNDPIARVQAISKYLKHIGLELSGDGFNAGIYRDIKDEVNRAKTLHENKDYKPVDWLAALTAELGEVAHEIDTAKESGKPLKPNYRTELIQVAAVCVRMIEDYRKSR